MGINVKLQVFEGPLDLLLHLIDKNKVNIYDIPIVMITEQYMEYVNSMVKEDLDVVSEYLVNWLTNKITFNGFSHNNKHLLQNIIVLAQVFHISLEFGFIFSEFFSKSIHSFLFFI